MSTSAGGGVGDVVSFKAAGDLSSDQYRAVYISAENTVDTCGTTAANMKSMGILQNKPDAAGKAADVQIGGISKAKSEATFTFNQELTTGTTGGFIPVADATHITTAIAIETADAAGDIVTVRIVSPTSFGATA